MLWQITLAVFSGILYALAFPPFNFSLLAWFALVPLLVIPAKAGIQSVNLSSNRVDSRLRHSGMTILFRLSRSIFITRFNLGLLTGFVANLVIFFWIWDTFKAAGIGFITTFSSWMALALIFGIYFGLFFLGLHFVKNPWLKPWLGAALWVCLEHIRSVILTGFPWALLSHTQVHNLPLIQIASITSAPGISFIIVAINVAIADGIRHSRESGNPGRRNLIRTMFNAWTPAFAGVTPVLALLLIYYVFGFSRLNHTSDIHPSKTLHVAILQGNIDQYKKWDAQYELDIRNQYETLAKKAAEAKPDLIIWPESAVPGWFPNDPFYANWVAKLVKETDTFNIVGACSASPEGEFNSAFFMDPKGEILDQYSKIHLVPFGEYIPFGQFLKRWVPYLGQLGIFTAGKERVLMSLRTAEGGEAISSMGLLRSPSRLARNDLKISVNICYEAIFSELVRNSVKEGADLIVNITNDGWFLKSGAPEQHYNANILRAVENARPVIRAANTGISGVIDPLGREILRTPLMESGEFNAEVPLYPKINTVFVRLGDWFSWLCWILVGGLGLHQTRQVFFPVRK